MIKKYVIEITALICLSVCSNLNAQRPLPIPTKPNNEKSQEIEKETQVVEKKQIPSKGWILSTGLARDIGIGGNGVVYVIGMNPRAGGYGIWKRINNNDWQEIGGGAVRIDVDDKGVPWVINSIGEIFKREGDNWRCMPGRANDIGIGGDGSVWIIGTNICGDGGFGIWKWTGKDWMTFDGAERMRREIAAIGAPQRALGQEMMRLGQAGQVTPAQRQQLEALAARERQQLAQRGLTSGTAAQQAQAQAVMREQRAAQDVLDQGLKIAGIGDQYQAAAIKAGYAADQATRDMLNTTLTNLYRTIYGNVQTPVTTSTTQTTPGGG